MFISNRTINLGNADTPFVQKSKEEIEAEEAEIDKKTVGYILKLKESNPQINPDVFAKALEYIRIGAQKKKKLWHAETVEQQRSRLYPDNQPRVFGRLWDEVAKRKQRQEKLKRATEKQFSEQWTNKLKEIKKAVWSRIIANRSDLILDSNLSHNKSQNLRSKSGDRKTGLKFSSTNFSQHKNSSTGRIDTAKYETSGLNINSVNLSMLNPNKIRESSFITDFVRNFIDKTEVEPKDNNYNISTQTDIKGRIYDEIDDEVLDELIEMNLYSLKDSIPNLNFGSSDISEYEALDKTKPNSSSNFSIWNNRRRSDA